MQVTTINIGKKRRFPITLLGHNGTLDTTTTLTVGSDASNATVIIDPSDNRSVIVTGVAQTPSGTPDSNGAGNSHITVSALGRTDLISVFTPTPPDQASLTVGVGSDEF